MNYEMQIKTRDYKSDPVVKLNRQSATLSPIKHPARETVRMAIRNSFEYKPVLWSKIFVWDPSAKQKLA